ncbi:MAG: DUF2029 domain-containing protein [Micrococcales bacterium]|nr:DUF2029 domain-containing protein [Micrococcales bacterium]
MTARGRTATASTAVLVVGIAVVTALSVATLGYYDPRTSGPALPLVTGAAWLLFAGAVAVLRAVPARAAGALILIGSVLIGGAAMLGPPNTSTDSARYAWDGIVQTNGLSPYRYAPASAATEELRPEWLFPAPVAARDGSVGCRGERILASSEPTTGERVCTAINRARFRTIYPPASEIVFAGVRLVVGPDARYWPIQLLGLLASVAITAILLRALPRRGRDPRWAALWAWCPLVANEAVTNSHIDVLAALLLLVATLAPSGTSGWRAGVALGTGMSVKLIPVIGVPALLGRRGWWKVIAGAVLVFGVLYVPYVLLSGIKVLGYLPRYLTEEGYEDGSRFALISAVLPPAVVGPGPVLVVAALVLAATAILVWRKTDPDRPWLGEVVMIGVTLLVVSPRYPWYALLLVPMIAMTGRWEWLAVPLAMTFRLLEPHPGYYRSALLVAVVLILGVTAARAGRPGLRRGWEELRHPLHRPSRAPATSPTVGA